MDWTNLGRILFTVFCFGTFAVILFGAYSKKAKGRYDEAAGRLFDDDDTPGHAPDNASSGVKK